MEAKFTLNKGQMEFLKSNRREVAITSGLGGGKSFILQLTFLLTCLRYPKSLHCYSSLSYGNMRDSSIPDFITLMNQCGIQYEESKSRHSFLVGPQGSKVIFRSQEAAPRMRTVQIGSLFCDELAYWDERNYTAFLGRLREPNGPLILRAASSPNGLNFFHKIFVESLDTKEHLNEIRRLIMTRSTDNRHLPQDYIRMLEETYDAKLIKQERDGLFINIHGGLTYHAFSREKNVESCPINNGKPMYIGMDFNVNPMTAVCVQHDGKVSRVVKEFFLENSNTEAMGKTIAAFFGGTRGISIIPDSTGNNRKTSSTLTDHAILREMGFDVPRFFNPLRKDRQNNINGRLDHGFIKIDPSCKMLIKDLESFVEEDEARTPMLGHISDALGYAEWYAHPINIRAGMTSNTGKNQSLLL